MIMTPRVRKLALTVHVACSVGTIGAVAAFLALALAGLAGDDAQIVRAAYIAMEPVAWFAIVPLVAAALVTGLVQALGTSWGLLRHYWVLAKLLLTVLVAVVLLQQMEIIGHLARAAAEATFGARLRALRWSLVIHAAGGLLVLLSIVALSLYKPRGMTRYGWRRQHAQRGERADAAT